MECPWGWVCERQRCISLTPPDPTPNPASEGPEGESGAALVVTVWSFSAILVVSYCRWHTWRCAPSFYRASAQGPTGRNTWTREPSAWAAGATHCCSESGTVCTAGAVGTPASDPAWCPCTSGSQGKRTHINSCLQTTRVQAAPSKGGNSPLPPGLDAAHRVQLGKVSWNRLGARLWGVLGYIAK